MSVRDNIVPFPGPAKQVHDACNEIIAIHERSLERILETQRAVQTLRPPLLKRINVNEYLPSDTEPAA